MCNNFYVLVYVHTECLPTVKRQAVIKTYFSTNMAVVVIMCILQAEKRIDTEKQIIDILTIVCNNYVRWDDTNAICCLAFTTGQFSVFILTFSPFNTSD